MRQAVSVRIHGRKWKEDGIVGRRRKNRIHKFYVWDLLYINIPPRKKKEKTREEEKAEGAGNIKIFPGPHISLWTDIFRYNRLTNPTWNKWRGTSVCRLFHPDIECLIWSMHARHNIIILKKEKEWREEVKGPHANDGRLCRRCACATAGEESLSSCAINSHPRGCSGCSPLTECARGEGGGEISRDPLRGAAAPAAAWVVKVCLCTGWGIQIFFSFSILYFGRLCFTVTSATSSSSCSLPPPPLEEEVEEL